MNMTHNNLSSGDISGSFGQPTEYSLNLPVSMQIPSNQDNKSSRRGSGSDSDGAKFDLTVLSDGTLMKVQKSRQRKVHSCVTCHKKKVKCSREHPICNNCKKSDSICKYFVNKRVSRGGRLSHQKTDLCPEYSNQSVEVQTSEYVSESAPVPTLNNYTDHDSTQNVGPEESKIPLTEDQDNHARMSASESIFSTTNSEIEHASNHGSSVTEFTGYSGQAQSPEVSSMQPIYSNDDFTVIREEKLHNPGQRMHPLEHMSMFNGASADFPALGNLRPIPSTDSVSNITNKFFNTNYHVNMSNATALDESFTVPVVPICFTPLPDMHLSNGVRSPAANAYANENFMHDLSKKQINHPEPEREFHAPAASSSQNQARINTVPGSNKTNKGPSGFATYANFLNSPGLAKSSVSNTHANLEPKRPAPFVSAQENSLNPYSSNPSRTVNYLYGTNDNYHSENIFAGLRSHLPTKKRSFELIERYSQSVHDLLPLLVNIREFTLEHAKFWERFDQNSSNPSEAALPDPTDTNLLQFYTLYFPVIYASTISEFEEYDNLLLNQDIDKYLKGFNKICQHYNYPHGLKSISLLLGNVIIQSTSPNPSTMEMSQIIRYAKFLQLHKDPVKTLRIQDWKVVRFRRKLWWAIFGLDALTSHNFCLPPVCRFDDFNVEMPEPYDLVSNENGEIVGKRLNVSILAMGVKFRFDRILSDMTYHLHNGLSSNISNSEIEAIKKRISCLFLFIHRAVCEVESYSKQCPAQSVKEMNVLEFVKHHSWSFADRAVMLLHKKILLADKIGNSPEGGSRELAPWTRQGGALSLSEYEDTFGRIQETNIVKNFDESSIAQLRFNQNKPFSYDDLQTNLIPSILHNLNDFLKYNDFIKYGKFNWYVKRTIPLDSIILLFVIMCVKLKYEFMGTSELVLFVKLINKSLFIVNRKYFKNEKYKRMLTLTNTTWEYILKKYNVLQRVSTPNGNMAGCAIEFLDHQVAGFLNMGELFTLMDVPQPVMHINNLTIMPPREDTKLISNQTSHQGSLGYASPSSIGRRDSFNDEVSFREARNEEDVQKKRTELLNLKQKIHYDLRNNFVDINDYCTFYQSLENLLHALMDYIDGQ